MAEQRVAGKVAKGGQPRTGSPAVPVLADQGVDKHLADKARKAAEVSHLSHPKNARAREEGGIS